jgi:hypothetical protein
MFISDPFIVTYTWDHVFSGHFILPLIPLPPSKTSTYPNTPSVVPDKHMFNPLSLLFENIADLYVEEY